MQKPVEVPEEWFYAAECRFCEGSDLILPNLLVCFLDSCFRQRDLCDSTNKASLFGTSFKSAINFAIVPLLHPLLFISLHPPSSKKPFFFRGFICCLASCAIIWREALNVGVEVFEWHNNHTGKCNFLCVVEMGLFQGDLINVPFANKGPSNLSLNKISSGVKTQEAVRVMYLSFCSKGIHWLGS